MRDQHDAVVARQSILRYILSYSARPKAAQLAFLWNSEGLHLVVILVLVHLSPSDLLSQHKRDGDGRPSWPVVQEHSCAPAHAITAMRAEPADELCSGASPDEVQPCP